MFACAGISKNFAIVIATGSGEVSSDFLIAEAAASSSISQRVDCSRVDNEIVCCSFNLDSDSV